MIRHLVSILLATLPVAASAHAADEALAIVNGVAAGDLLNVRADASPIGHVETRLGNGEALRKLECSDFNGYPWCKVQVVERPDITGWVPARYLLPVDPEGTATAAALPDDAGVSASNTAVAADPSQQGDTGSPPASASPMQPSSSAPAIVAPNLAARFGDPLPAAEAAATAHGQSLPSGLTSAEADAYRLAFASQANAAASASQEAQAGDVASDGTTPPSAGVMVEDEASSTVTQGAASGVPLPTPRPQLPGEPPTVAGQPAANEKGAAEVASAVPGQTATAATQLAALPEELKASGQTWDATGEIPCARYVGQPMTSCKAGVKREGDGKADVTVTWPDGGTRVIGFNDGKPADVDSHEDLRFTREGSLNMIRVGVSERFEIPDALAFGG